MIIICFSTTALPSMFIIATLNVYIIIVRRFKSDHLIGLQRSIQCIQKPTFIKTLLQNFRKSSIFYRLNFYLGPSIWCFYEIGTGHFLYTIYHFEQVLLRQIGQFFHKFLPHVIRWFSFHISFGFKQNNERWLCYWSNRHTGYGCNFEMRQVVSDHAPKVELKFICNFINVLRIG